MSDQQDYVRADYHVILETILNPGSEEEKVHHFQCSEVDFARFVRAFERGKRESIHYKSLSYDGERERLKFVTIPTSIHEASSTWFNWWVCDLGLGSHMGTRAELLEELQSNGPKKSKQPDAGLYVPPSRPFPTIAVETGYSESYEDLVEDAKLLLSGTKGDIGVVILVKLTPLKPGENRVSHGFVEVWYYDFQQQCPATMTGKKTLYPVPKSASHQKVTLTWDIILREQHNNFQSDLIINPPPLRLDKLRESIDEATARMLTQDKWVLDKAIHTFQKP